MDSFQTFLRDWALVGPAMLTTLFGTQAGTSPLNWLLDMLVASAPNASFSSVEHLLYSPFVMLLSS